MTFLDITISNRTATIIGIVTAALGVLIPYFIAIHFLNKRIKENKEQNINN